MAVDVTEPVGEKVAVMVGVKVTVAVKLGVFVGE